MHRRWMQRHALLESSQDEPGPGCCNGRQAAGVGGPYVRRGAAPPSPGMSLEEDKDVADRNGMGWWRGKS